MWAGEKSLALVYLGFTFAFYILSFAILKDTF
jgi:hypothetical protein